MTSLTHHNFSQNGGHNRDDYFYFFQPEGKLVYFLHNKDISCLVLVLLPIKHISMSCWSCVPQSWSYRCPFADCYWEALSRRQFSGNQKKEWSNENISTAIILNLCYGINAKISVLIQIIFWSWIGDTTLFKPTIPFSKTHISLKVDKSLCTCVISLIQDTDIIKWWYQ